MNTSVEIARHLHEAYYGRNWTWVCLEESLKDIGWQQAVAQPCAGTNTISALLFHMTFYVTTVYQRAHNQSEAYSHQDSFTAPDIRDEHTWQEQVRETFEAADKLTALIERFPDTRLHEEILPGKGTYYKNFHGLIEHCYYHMGQIVLLSKCQV